MRSSCLFFVASAVGMMMLAPAPSLATPVTGTLNITGDATVGAVTLTFLCDILSAMPCPANSGAFAVTGAAAQSGDFVALANTTGYIQSLNATTSPINSSFSLPNFLTFNATPDIVFDLSYIYAGTGGACPPSGAGACTPMIPALVSASNPSGLSPFNLANTAQGSSASFTVAGDVRRVSTNEMSPFNGTFTAQFTNTPGTTDASVASILAQFAANGSITTSYSSTFVATAGNPVPEPVTAGLMLGGLGLIAVARARRRART